MSKLANVKISKLLIQDSKGSQYYYIHLTNDFVFHNLSFAIADSLINCISIR